VVKKNPAEAGSLVFQNQNSGICEAAIQHRSILIPIIGIAPISELLYFLSDQHFDRFPQLLFKEPGVKTHTREYLFDIIEHFHFQNLKVRCATICAGCKR
jgi:hypothetical protein